MIATLDNRLAHPPNDDQVDAHERGSSVGARVADTFIISQLTASSTSFPTSPLWYILPAHRSHCFDPFRVTQVTLAGELLRDTRALRLGMAVVEHLSKK